jgi:hypothetical protein
MRSTSAASQFLPENICYQKNGPTRDQDGNKTSTTDCRQSFQALRRNTRA